MHEITFLNRKRQKQYGILKATIELGRCLDLNTPEHCGILQDTRAALINRVEDPDDLTDAFIINWFASNVELDTVRWTMTPERSREIYPKSRIRGNEPMICVRNVANISEISLIEEERK